MARLNSMYNSIGSMATRMLHGTQAGSAMAQAAQASSRAYGGIGGAAVTNMLNKRAAVSNVKMGKTVLGVGAAMGGLGMANRRSPVGGYNPRRPVVPVPQNGRPV